jgi:asparagine synthase (glutamine-hydrolysing)
VPDLVASHDEPCFDCASPSTLALARLARRHGVRVILTSQGAAEIFAGHAWYADAHPSRLEALRRLVAGRRAGDTDLLAKHLARSSPLGARPGAGRLLEGTTFDPLASLRRFDQPGAPGGTRLQLIDLQTQLVDGALLESDRASMSCGVELRVPFLDHELVETAFSIDHRVLFAEAEPRALLKRAAASWLPPELLSDAEPAPGSRLAGALRSALCARASALLPDGMLVAHRLLPREGVTAALASQVSQAAVWLLLAAELWARRWLEPSSPALAELLARGIS